MTHRDNFCPNCKVAYPKPPKTLGGKSQVFEKICVNCRRPAPRQSMRSGKPTQK